MWVSLTARSESLSLQLSCSIGCRGWPQHGCPSVQKWQACVHRIQHRNMKLGNLLRGPQPQRCSVRKARFRSLLVMRSYLCVLQLLPDTADQALLFLQLSVQ